MDGRTRLKTEIEVDSLELLACLQVMLFFLIVENEGPLNSFLNPW